MYIFDSLSLPQELCLKGFKKKANSMYLFCNVQKLNIHILHTYSAVCILAQIILTDCLERLLDQSPVVGAIQIQNGTEPAY